MKLLKEELKRKAKDPFHRIRMERANEIKVNSVREVRRQAALTSYDVGRKVFIFLDAEKMNEESANALLKTLEEPTPNTLFILIATRQEALPPTIVSRCQIIRFDPLGEDDIITALVDRYQIPHQNAAEAARRANGSFIRALQWIDPEAAKRKEIALNFLRTVLIKSRKEINEWIFNPNLRIREGAAVSEDNQDREYKRRDYTEMFLFLQQWFRDAMRMREGIVGSEDISDRESIDRFNKNFPNWEYTSTVEVLEKSISLVDKNVYIPLILINVAHGLRRAIGEMKAN